MTDEPALPTDRYAPPDAAPAKKMTFPNPMLVVISGPSGVGKSTIVSVLAHDHPQVVPIVTATTRDRRDGEVDKVHYHFLSVDEFERMRNNPLVTLDEMPLMHRQRRQGEEGARDQRRQTRQGDRGAKPRGALGACHRPVGRGDDQAAAVRHERDAHDLPRRAAQLHPDDVRRLREPLARLAPRVRCNIRGRGGTPAPNLPR